jgi:hypothetical protein
MSPDEFSVLVREYKALVEGAGQLTAHGFLYSCARALPRIYAAGIDLPDLEPRDIDVPPSVESPMRHLRALLGPYDNYFEIFDPYEEQEAVRGLISDDLAGIYLDLVNPLRDFEAGRIGDAVWTWKVNVRGHCGDHIVDAMRAIHRLVHNHLPPDYVASDGRVE